MKRFFILCFALVFVLPGLSQAAVNWDWSFGGTEAGTFETDDGVLQPSGETRYTITDFSVTTSDVEGGDFTSGDPAGFYWDGFTATSFFTEDSFMGGELIGCSFMDWVSGSQLGTFLYWFGTNNIDPTDAMLNVFVPDLDSWIPDVVEADPIVSGPVTVAPVSLNEPPVAAAGIYVDEATSWDGVLVTLDGTGSSDPDEEDELSYSWQMNGSEIGTVAVLDYTFPIGITDISLTVTDLSGESDTDDTNNPETIDNPISPICHQLPLFDISIDDMG